MGFMLFTLLALTAAFVWLEFKLYKSIPFLRKLNEKSALAGLAIGLGISFVIGMLFPAAGVLMLLASLGSTALTEPVHAIRRSVAKGNQRVAVAKATADELWATWKPLLTVIKYGVIVLTAPVWVPMVIRRKLLAYQAEQEAATA